MTSIWSAPAPIPEKLKDIVIKYKADVEKALHQAPAFKLFTPTTFRYLVVEGIKYLVNVKVSEFLPEEHLVQVELFEDLKQNFHFVNAIPLYHFGTKYKSHLHQYAAEQTTTTPASQTPPLGPGPAKPPKIPLGPGPVIPIHEWKPVDKQVTDLANQQREAAENYLHTKFTLYNPVEYGTTKSGLWNTIYYIIVETSERTLYVLGEPQVTKYYTEIVVEVTDAVKPIFERAINLGTGLPPLTPDNTHSGTGNPTNGPYKITKELSDVTIKFKKDAEKYTGQDYPVFNPAQYYTQLQGIATTYWVQVAIGLPLALHGPPIIYVKLNKPLLGPSNFSFVSAGDELN